MRIGVFGGSFDPVHFGHLRLAEAAWQACGLDRVWFVPARVPPHKQDERLTSSVKRVEMLNLALADYPVFEVCQLELERDGVSYTVDTLRQIRAERGDDELFLLLGGDSLVDLPNWRSPKEICTLATPVAVARPGAEEPDFSVLSGVVPADALEQFRKYRVTMEPVGIASSEIRRRVAAGESIADQTPQQVVDYIEAAGLYRD